MDNNHKLFFYVNSATFILYAILASTVIAKLRFKLDRVSILSMMAVLLSFLVRFINWLVFAFKTKGFFDNSQEIEIKPTFLMIDAAATCVFHMNAYFFSFEMKSVHEQIKS